MANSTDRQLIVLVPLDHAAISEGEGCSAALEKFEELRSTGFEVILLLPVPPDRDTAAKRVRWLKTHFGKEWIKNTVVTDFPQLVRADFLVADSTWNMTEQLDASMPQPAWRCVELETWAEFDCKRLKTQAQDKEFKSLLWPDTRRGIILVDMDNTLNNFNQQVCRKAAEALGLPEPIAKSTRVVDDFAPEHDRAIKDIYQAEGLTLELDPVNGAIDAVHTLVEEHHVFIVTAPPMSDFSLGEKVEWVRTRFEERLTKKLSSRVLVTHQKTLIAGDILVDDAPNPLGSKALPPTWKHLAFEQPWNTQCAERVNWSNAVSRIRDVLSKSPWLVPAFAQVYLTLPGTDTQGITEESISHTP
eukprot:gnl/MRDRNA2_/MRDRNA2_31535_c0_seq1.p1 gnl/MRDRNA2_/MRDRNA2_31535_c0~~gnl/MRDRNA2_/MRDRNA2_31535_c0_seq1.p1  ORF type:complete len:359 (-),score=58.72 gnl/MRDRNA2_/MRDRNA2_31535_c0_seq1:3-1079(-)